MLIAIMGDTFEQVIENQDLNSTKTKLQVMSELADIIFQQTGGNFAKDVMRFLFVVTPDEDE